MDPRSILLVEDHATTRKLVRLALERAGMRVHEAGDRARFSMVVAGRPGFTPVQVEAWTEHVKAIGAGLLSNEVDSWFTGVNTNVDGKRTRTVARYSGSAPAYRARCDEVAASGYEELLLA